MLVQLLTHTPEPEQAVAAAARLCYSASSVGELMDRSRSEDQGSFIEKIVSMGHLSVLEHATFTFGIEGISRACSHQLVRHRIASFSQQSQRYVSHEKHFEAVIPPTIEADPELRELFDRSLAQIHEVYGRLIEAGVPAEDARFVLPNAAATKIVVTMNGRELRHFFELRCCERAQWEIRAMAVEMLRLARAVSPVLFGSAGPGCIAGHCPEGKKCCGKMAQVREAFAKL